ncbi:TPA: GPO family capsid scaffolding protein [Klebsiella pneumoniae]|nr:GPO family capsid scaffolding protein [Klebsiella pneumoniae]HDY4998483.1 GPO family capsid scaffolding protein [Klebsiella pneumoniae]
MTAQVTDWICICTSGAAIDGRPIEASMLLEVAERYDASFYTALIWPYHSDDFEERERWVPNYGIVHALKAEETNGEVRLYAKISPNQYLIEANKHSQKLFTSCEFWPDFQGQGYYYLQALAVTDIPASTGTAMLKFSAQSREKGLQPGGVMEFTLGKLTPLNKQSLLDKVLMGMKLNKFTPEGNSGSESEAENMDELKKLLQDMMQQMKEMSDAARGNTTSTEKEAADEVQAAAEEIAELAEEVAELAEEVAENPEDEVVAEEFSARREELCERITELGKGKSRFSASRRRRRRSFSATRRSEKSGEKADGKVAGIEQKIDLMIETLSAIADKSVTPVPGKKPGTDNKKFTVL